MGSNCDRERSCLAGFLSVLKHSLLLDTNGTADLEKEVRSSSGSLILALQTAEMVMQLLFINLTV